MMKIRSLFRLTLLAVPLVLALQGEAAAQACEEGCGLQVKACMSNAIPAMLACKLDCRASTIPTELGVCMRGCSDIFDVAKDGCRADLRDCEEACEPGPTPDPIPDPSEDPSDPPEPTPDVSTCLDECGLSLGTCASGVTATTRACITECRAGTHKRGGCMKQCVGPAKEGAQLCGEGFRTCMLECGVELAERVPHCQDSEVPVCGGLCGGLSQTCAQVGPARCGCVRE